MKNFHENSLSLSGILWSRNFLIHTKKMEAGTNTSDRCSLVSSHTVILSICFRHYMGDFASGLPSKDAVSLLTEYVCQLFKNLV